MKISDHVVSTELENTNPYFFVQLKLLKTEVAILICANAGAATLQFTSIRTPDTKERSSASVRAATLQSTSIPTPVTKERARISRKRKCVYDDIVVLPNKYVIIIQNCILT